MYILSPRKVIFMGHEDYITIVEKNRQSQTHAQYSNLTIHCENISTMSVILPSRSYSKHANFDKPLRSALIKKTPLSRKRKAATSAYNVIVFLFLPNPAAF